MDISIADETRSRLERMFVGTVVEVRALLAFGIDINSIVLTYVDGRQVKISPVGDWGQEAWIRISEQERNNGTT